MGLFNDTAKARQKNQIPVWFMRQAGRYHQHYQNIKRQHDFISMCKTPRLACEITLGPIEAFDFDAAILFSDLLFPLEQLGMGLTYAPGPRLGFQLETIEDLRRLKVIEEADQFFRFQGDALSLLTDALPSHVTLLGFVGAPFTLYTYAVEGGHKGELTSAKRGLADGRWQGFCEKLYPNLLAEMKLQASAGADAICLFDTAAGELSGADYRQFAAPQIRQLCADFKGSHPHHKLIYYSKHTHLAHLRSLESPDIDVLGIDWRVNLTEALATLGDDYMIQGNLDPSLLHLPWERLEPYWDEIWQQVLRSEVSPDRWICGLGHGVLQHTPEINVKKSVAHIHQNFNC